jgi:hypothetical protein
VPEPMHAVHRKFGRMPECPQTSDAPLRLLLRNRQLWFHSNARLEKSAAAAEHQQHARNGTCQRLCCLSVIKARANTLWQCHHGSTGPSGPHPFMVRMNPIRARSSKDWNEE